MAKVILGLGTLVLFGTLGANSGAITSAADAKAGLTVDQIGTEVDRGRTEIQAETCSVCVSNCWRIYELLSRECADKRKYRTKMQIRLCRAMASEEHGRCLKQCNHNK
jgi:hypothetical protein